MANTTINSSGVTFPDNTIQATAVYGGITTLTLSSASPSATLTSASNQYIRVVVDTTTPYAPSIVMPDMTTLAVGQGRFIVSNETGLNLAVKDTGGTIREYIAPMAKVAISITSIATANGVWYFNNSPVLIGDNPPTSTLFASSAFMATTTNAIPYGNIFVVPLDSTNFALVWDEGTNGNSANWNFYAKLYTINTSTGAFTAGNRITIASGNGATNAFQLIAYDSDNAGHALVVFGLNQTSGGGQFSSVGLSASGGTLYASTVTTVTTNPAACHSYSVSTAWCCYLGSNSAYAYGFTIFDGGGNPTQYIRGCTVTGTTVVTQTQSANNTSVNAGSNSGVDTWLNGRTSLTTFVTIATSGATAFAGGRYVSYTPASNTFTVGNRTVATTPTDIELDSNGYSWYMSFANGGYTYCSGKACQQGQVYDITNAGAAGVTATRSTSFAAKPQISTNYVTVTGGMPIMQLPVASFIVSSSKILTLVFPFNISSRIFNTPIGYYQNTSKYGTRLIQSDPSSSTFNIGIGGASYSSNSSGLNCTIVPWSKATILSSSYAVFLTQDQHAFGNQTTISMQVVPLATSIV